MLYLSILFNLARFSFFRNLLIKYPDFFTLGVFKSNGPSAQQLAETSFESRFVAKGYGKNDDMSAEPSIEMMTMVQGPEPGYVTTPICVVGCAAMLLNHQESIPFGVLTPGSAFNNVLDSLLDRFAQRGLHFSIVSKSGFE